MQRPTWDTYFMKIATIAATRGTCKRAKVGAIVVNSKNQIVATGYNGAPKGLPHCEKSGCIMQDSHCVRCLHAEMNALLQVSDKADNGTIYCTHMPCPICLKIAIQQGVKRVVYLSSYNDAEVVAFMKKLGVKKSVISVQKYK